LPARRRISERFDTAAAPIYREINKIMIIIIITTTAARGKSP
jgi:hypothetical protein